MQGFSRLKLETRPNHILIIVVAHLKELEYRKLPLSSLNKSLKTTNTFKY